MKLVRKYCFVAQLAARSNMAYLSEVASRVVFLAVILYIFMRLWQVTYAGCHKEVLGGLTIEQMLWYLTVTESIMLSAPRVTQLVDQEVRSGAVVVQLIRPVSYPVYHLFNNLGERLVRFILFLLVGSGVVSLLVGLPKVSVVGLCLFVISLPLAFAVDFCGCFAIGLAAFWLEDTSGLFLLYSRISMILGGMLIPLELFPQWLVPVLKALPFQAVVYGPAHQFVSPNTSELVALLATQIAAFAVLSLVVAGLWNLALRRVLVNGG